ncbi:MAG: DciA family protein [Ignavibacteriales bacterium]
MTPLKEALDSLVHRLGLAKRAASLRVIEMWAAIAGPQIAGRTTAVRVSDGVLYVDVESPAWASELTFMKQDLVDRLNAKAGEVCVRDIRFRSRRLRGTDPGGPQAGSGWANEVTALLRSVGNDSVDEAAAERIAGEASPLQMAMKRLILAHRRLGRARSLAGWITCPGCGRMYDKGSGHCPRCGPGGAAGGRLAGAD